MFFDATLLQKTRCMVYNTKVQHGVFRENPKPLSTFLVGGGFFILREEMENAGFYY